MPVNSMTEESVYIPYSIRCHVKFVPNIKRQYISALQKCLPRVSLGVIRLKAVQHRRTAFKTKQCGEKRREKKKM